MNPTLIGVKILEVKYFKKKNTLQYEWFWATSTHLCTNEQIIKIYETTQLSWTNGKGTPYKTLLLAEKNDVWYLAWTLKPKIIKQNQIYQSL